MRFYAKLKNITDHNLMMPLLLPIHLENTSQAVPGFAHWLYPRTVDVFVVQSRRRSGRPCASRVSDVAFVSPVRATRALLRRESSRQRFNLAFLDRHIAPNATLRVCSCV